MAQIVQDTQSLKNKIISALDFLSLDNLQMLYRFIAFLRMDTNQSPISPAEDSIWVHTPRTAVRITSPRLLHREQVADFTKEIVEYDEDDCL